MSGPRTKDISGQKFGRLTALHVHSRRLRPAGGRVTYWMCECACGNRKAIDGQELRKGATKSCGCWHREFAAINPNRLAATVKHGSHDIPEYSVWEAMIQRCSNPKDARYKDYGGRGIRVCDRWRDFRCFIEDMGHRPTAAHSLDRFPDNNGNYEHDNCRWATRKEQDFNKRNNRIITAFGRTAALGQFIQPGTNAYRKALWRLNHGWLPEAALRVF